MQPPSCGFIDCRNGLHRSLGRNHHRRRRDAGHLFASLYRFPRQPRDQGRRRTVAATGAAGNPWQNYFAARVAVVTPSAIYRSMLRDKLHRARSRRLVAPLGVVIDEAERHTLIGADGRAFHRCVGDRFLDTLLWVQGETNHKFTLSYGFDVPAPVAVARTFIAPPIQVPITAPAGAAEIGWIIHTAPKEIVISDLQSWPPQRR